VRPDDRRRHGDAEDGAGAEAHLRPDARPEMGHLHGRLLERRRAVQHLRRAAGRGPDRSRGRVCHRLPAAARESLLRPAEASGQDRPDEPARAPHRSAARGVDAGRFPAPGDGGADPHPRGVSSVASLYRTPAGLWRSPLLDAEEWTDHAFGTALTRLEGEWLELKQVHSTHVAACEQWRAGLQADGLVSATPRVRLAIKTADCLPILLADPRALVVA